MDAKAIMALGKLHVTEQSKALDTLKNKLKKEMLATEAKRKAEYVAYVKSLAGYNDEVKKYNAALAASAKTLKDGFAAARADYMAIVKDTDGLTSVKPSVVKALERYRDTANAKFLDEALTNLAKHRDEVVKAAGKSDKKAAKFAAEIDKMIKAGQ
jgi:hypothetical protein